MQSVEKKELFERMPIPRAIAKMAVPTVISQLINLIYNVVDTFFIGRAGNVYMTAAVTTTYTLYMMTNAFGNMFGMGGGSLIARLNGQGKAEEGKSVSAFSVWGCSAMALLYSLLVALTMEPLLRLLGANDDSLPFACQYLLVVVVLGNLPVILSLTLSHILRNAGYSKQASLGLSLGGVLNIALDPLLMFWFLPRFVGPDLEVLGAAIATAFSNLVSCLYLLTVLRRISSGASLSLKLKDALQVSRENLRKLFAVGLPSAILTALFDLANIVLNKLMSTYGQMQMAALGIVMKAERLPNAINLGLSQGMMPIVAYNYASGDHARMKETIRFSRWVGLGITLTCVILYQIFAPQVTHVFLFTGGENAENALKTIGYATLFLRIRCLSSPLQFLNYNTSYCLQGVGSGSMTLLHAFVREIVFYIPFMFILNGIFGMNGLAASIIGGEGCGAIFAMLLWMLWLNKNKKIK